MPRACCTFQTCRMWCTPKYCSMVSMTNEHFHILSHSSMQINKTKQKTRRTWNTWNDYGIFWAQSSRPRGSNATNVRGTRGEDLQIKCKSALRTAANSQSAVTFSTSCCVSLLCLTLFNQVSKFPSGHLQTDAVRILSLLTLVYSRQSLSWPEKIEINGGR